MNMRVIVCCAAIAMVLSSSAIAQTKAVEAPKNTVATDYHARLEASATQLQTRIGVLEAQLADPNTKDRESIERQIVEMKRQGEIDRLQILLDWARAQGDASRVEEIQQVLNQWQNPPQPQHLPEAVKGVGSPRASNDKVPDNSNSSK